MSRGSGPRQRCYVSRPMGLQHSPLSLGPAARCGVDMLHNAPSPAPLPLPGAGCWGLTSWPGDNTPTAPTSSKEPKEVAGPGCVPRYLLVEVAPEGLLGHNTGGHLPAPQRARSLFNKSLTLPHSQSVFCITISCHHGGHGTEEPLGRRAALQEGASSLSFPPTSLQSHIQGVQEPQGLVPGVLHCEQTLGWSWWETGTLLPEMSTKDGTSLGLVTLREKHLQSPVPWS